MSWLTVCEMVIGAGTGETKGREQGWKNIKYDKHGRVNQQVQQNARPNEIDLKKKQKEIRLNIEKKPLNFKISNLTVFCES